MTTPIGPETTPGQAVVRALDSRTALAEALMADFADRTGLSSGRLPRRYLWTDAFAVCNYLGLARVTGNGSYVELARRLVDRVHHALGRHRPDGPRAGWLSGLGEREGEAHPTRGGLRIGKPLPERGPTDPPSEREEWDRDGQYFHYLTRWMHALDQVARATGEPRFNAWARELADVAHRAFVYAPRTGARPRMFWKMSVDLTRPLVASTGQHDPLDGFVTCVQLDATAARLCPDAPRLAAARADYAAMLEPSRLATADPLGLGGLMLDASRVAQLMQRGPLPGGEVLLTTLLGAARVGLRSFLAGPELRAPAGRRLAFRELGLAIGLAALGSAEGALHAFGGSAARALLAGLTRLGAVRRDIEGVWLREENRRAPAWRANQDINDVMLAASLRPEGVVELPDPRPGEPALTAGRRQP